ncbi:MAG TPA: replication protein P [Pseudomonadales bacterium]
MVQAINRMFAEFKLVFSNQYLKAFPDESATALARQLWFSYLKDYQPDTILEATHRAIRESSFLPTVHDILKHCDALERGDLPEVWQAYQEACNASEPKAAYPWSHSAVYHAGNEVGWYFLSTTASERAFPVFRRVYQQLCERVAQGEVFDVTAPEALPKPIRKPLPRDEAIKRMQAIRALLDGDQS